MKQIDGEEDSVLTWGRSVHKQRQCCKHDCEGVLNVQKSAEVIVRWLLQQFAEGLNMK
ncbi:hypothetical protein I6N90_00925 [Paenibacillus sp. GSMTC-2017]|nr:hypothetical protein [Paenibacillus sp. GSMTC-2017]